MRQTIHGREHEVIKLMCQSISIESYLKLTASLKAVENIPLAFYTDFGSSLLEKFSSGTQTFMAKLPLYREGAR